MAEIVLDIKLDGENSLQDELTAFLKNVVSPAVTKALDSVGSDMAGALKRHIESDVYDHKWYVPEEYQRRSEHPDLGTPLSDMGDLTIGGSGNATLYNHGNGLTFDYSPTGEHTTKRWHTTDGDALIGRIENFDPPYSWTSKHQTMPKRKFWQKFVDEMVDDGALEQYFVNALMLADASLQVNASGEVIREDADGRY